MTLRAADFSEFFEQVYGYRPFPWQQDLTEWVLTEGRWPELVDVPTGLGKTAMLDVAVFVAAATVNQDGPDRLGRRRILFVVDRRIVVDEAAERARTLATALAAAERENQGALSTVAQALRRYAPDTRGEVLSVTRMRGGITWASAWLDRPDRPGIVVGTVDQVGSRLLFRGYGVSDRRRPIDAALTGTDALLLVDEAHLAAALTTTLAAARERDRPQAAVPLPGLNIVELTATPGREAEAYPFNVPAHEADAVAGQRLRAEKRLLLWQTTPRDTPKALADAAARLANVTDQTGGEAWPPAVLVVCNTVDRARAVHTLLAKTAVGRGGEPVLDLDLLIGRSRPADRPGIQERILGRFGTHRARAERPAVLVATQTVEVGINLDADALVTESASWDALVQRLGRLNRLGSFAERRPGSARATAVVVHDGQADGPVYGAARDETWTYLSYLRPPIARLDAVADPATPGLDVSPKACRVELRPPPEAMSETTGTPILQTPTLEAWTQTAPVPDGDPPVEPFLHGFSSGSPGVLLAWRDGLLSASDPLDDLFEDGDVPATAATVNALLDAVPLRSAEQVEVPLHAVRQWLSGQAVAPVSDIEGSPDAAVPVKVGMPRGPVLVWRSSGTDAGQSGSWVWTTDDRVRLRPGDQVVVPAEYGGLDGYGWHPAGTAKVSDRSEYAHFANRRPLLRLDSALPGRLGSTGPAATELRAAIAKLYEAGPGEPDGDGEDPEVAVRRALYSILDGLTEIPDVGVSGDRLVVWLSSRPKLVNVLPPQAAEVIGGNRPARPILYLLTGGEAPDLEQPLPADLRDRFGDPSANSGESAERDDESATASSIALRPVTLTQHHDRVRDRAHQIATALRLPEDLRRAVCDAAGWHDLGKREERFQINLHGGDEAAAMIAPEPLAKSGMPPEDRDAWRRARERSKLPHGARHEAWSAALVEAYLTKRPDPYEPDADLVVHLVASHHGHARPWLPPIVDRAPRPIIATIDGVTVEICSDRTVSFDHPARFAELNKRYGRWGLTLLETIVRCADMTVSAEGS